MSPHVALGMQIPRHAQGKEPLRRTFVATTITMMVHWLVQQHPIVVVGGNSDSSLAFHIACVTKQLVQVIQVLVQQHPKAVKEHHIYGRHPLQVASSDWSVVPAAP